MIRHLNPRAIERARARDLAAIKSQTAKDHSRLAELDELVDTIDRDVDRLNEIDPDELVSREFVLDLEDKIDAVKSTVTILLEGPPPERGADPARVADIEQHVVDLRGDLSQSINDYDRLQNDYNCHDSLLDDIADWMRTHNFLS